LDEGFKRSKKDWRICENMMYVAIDCKDMTKLLFAINNLFLLDKSERVKPSIFYTVVTFYIKGYPNFNDHQKKYLKDRIYDIFKLFAEKDGISTEVWDLYIYFIQSVEIECFKVTDVNEVQILNKKMMELRLKQTRTLMIPEWEKDEKVIDKLKEVIKKSREELIRVTNEIYYKEVNTFIESVENKIDRFYKTKEYNSQMNL
jgi:hypothetical protein